jgi:hypothetical protein
MQMARSQCDKPPVCLFIYLFIYSLERTLGSGLWILKFLIEPSVWVPTQFFTFQDPPHPIHSWFFSEQILGRSGSKLNLTTHNPKLKNYWLHAKPYIQYIFNTWDMFQSKNNMPNATPTGHPTTKILLKNFLNFFLKLTTGLTPVRNIKNCNQLHFQFQKNKNQTLV